MVLDDGLVAEFLQFGQNCPRVEIPATEDNGDREFAILHFPFGSLLFGR
jgi:hypothetical protein